jgi:hypothetical protein
VLYNRYVMGRNSIARGSTDTWTPRPHRYAAVEARLAAGAGGGAGAGAGRGGGGGRGGRGGADESALWSALRAPEDRDPRGYILPASQPDFATATRFVNALLETGVIVERATREFTAGGRTYPAGSLIVPAAQAFRPHVIDMFEPQDHPDNFAYAGGPPTRPYDAAGWTLAFQMGVEFDRILEPFSGPFERVNVWNLPMPAAAAPAEAPAYRVSPAQLDAFVAVNRLLAAGEEVLRQPDGGFIVRSRPSTRAIVERAARERGVAFAQATASAAGVALRAPRIGLWDQYGGSMDSGWARWILEQFEFPFSRVFVQEIDAGNLNAKYDTLVFVDGGLPAAAAGGRGGAGAGGRGAGGGARGAGAGAAGRPDIPAEFQSHLGSMSADRSLPQIKAFIEGGGTVIAIARSAENLAEYLDLPMTDHLVENGQPLPQTKFYAPSSVLRARVDTGALAASGLRAETDVFYDNGPVWRLRPDAAARGVRPIVWFDSAAPLRSGWAWGQHYLDGGVAGVEARVGKGRVLLYGVEIIQRAQPHGTFKLLFNGLYGQ